MSHENWRPRGMIFDFLFSSAQLVLANPSWADLIFSRPLLQKYLEGGKLVSFIRLKSGQISIQFCGSNYEISVVTAMDGFLLSLLMAASRSSRFNYDFGGGNSQFDLLGFIGNQDNPFILIGEVLSDGGPHARTRGGKQYHAFAKILRDYSLRKKSIACMVIGPDKYCNDRNGNPVEIHGTVKDWYYQRLFREYLLDESATLDHWWEPYFTLPAKITVNGKIDSKDFYNPNYRGTWRDFWDLIGYTQRNLGMDSSNFNIFDFLQKINAERERVGISLELRLRIERILDVFCWDYNLHSVPSYLMAWINDFNDLSQRQNTLCQLLFEVTNRKNPNDFAFAQSIMAQFFFNEESSFLGMTAREIIQKIANRYGIERISEYFPFWDLVPDDWRPT